MKPDLKKAITGGVVGTIVMTLMAMYLAPMMTGMPMDIAAMIAGMMGMPWLMGMMGHLMMGIVVFPLILCLCCLWPGAGQSGGQRIDLGCRALGHGGDRGDANGGCRVPDVQRGRHNGSNRITDGASGLWWSVGVNCRWWRGSCGGLGVRHTFESAKWSARLGGPFLFGS